MDVFKPVVTEVAELVMKQIHEVVRTSKKAPKVRLPSLLLFLLADTLGSLSF